MTHRLELFSQAFVVGAVVAASLLTIVREMDRLEVFESFDRWVRYRVDVMRIRRAKKSLPKGARRG